MRTFLIILWGVDAAGALVRVEYFDSAQPENAWVKVLVTDEGARVRAVCVYGVQDEAKAGSQSVEFASAVEDAQAWLGQCPESVEVEGVTLVPVSTSVFSYDGNDSRLVQVSSDGSGSSLTYGAAGFVSSVASWGSAEDSAVSFSLLCASVDGRVLAAGGAPVGVPEFGVPSTGANAGSVAGFDASVMHPLVWDENSFVPRVLGVGGSSLPSVGSLVPGAGSGAGLLDPYGWVSLGVVAPAVPSAQGASAAGGAPVLPDSLVGVSAASGVVLGSSGFEVLGARVVDSRVARFTAPDPLAAPVGAAWGADRFSLVGGNPVLLVDSWGLSPVSVEDFDKYREQKVASGGWLQNNWEYVAAGAMLLAGAVVGALGTGLGPFGGAAFGAASGALMGAGMSVIEQKMSGEKVDWSKAGKEAAKGALTGAVTGAVTGGLGSLKKLADATEKISKIGKAAQKAGTYLKNNKLVEDVVKDSVSGGINNVVSYCFDDKVKDKSITGAMGMFASGATASAVGAVAGGKMKSKWGVAGYEKYSAPSHDPSDLLDSSQMMRSATPTTLWETAKKSSFEFSRDVTIDTLSGAAKNSVQERLEMGMQGRENSPQHMDAVLAKGIQKDELKSSFKTAVKMTPEDAAENRAAIAGASRHAVGVTRDAAVSASHHAMDVTRQAADITRQTASHAKDRISDAVDWAGDIIEERMHKWKK